jgi:hypothetical protein
VLNSLFSSQYFAAPLSQGVKTENFYGRRCDQIEILLLKNLWRIWLAIGASAASRS